MKRELNLPNEVNIPNNINTRHFGGYAAADGKTVIREKLIRSGTTTGFQQEDKRILLDEYKLKRVIDFRATAEIEKAPPADIPGTEYMNIPLEDEAEYPAEEYEKRLEVHGAAQQDVPLLILLFYYMGGTLEGVQAYFQDVSYRVVATEFGQKAWTAYFDALLNDDGGSTLFHCTAGKDRTGIAAILTLTALGVDWEQCLADYLLTNEYIADTTEESMKEVLAATDDPLVIEGCRLILSVDAAYLDKAVDYMNAEYGSIDGYLAEAVGLTEDKRKKLREIYTR